MPTLIVTLASSEIDANTGNSTISKLHAKVATLETELAAIKQHLGI